MSSFDIFTFALRKSLSEVKVRRELVKVKKVTLYSQLSYQKDDALPSTFDVLFKPHERGKLEIIHRKKGSHNVSHGLQQRNRCQNDGWCADTC